MTAAGSSSAISLVSASDADNRTRATIAAIYVQDQIRLSPGLEIVAGIRFDRFKLSVDDLRGAGAEFARKDTMVSPRLGVIAKPRPNLSLYASYSRSFLPQSGDQFAGLNLTTEMLKPERFDNLEVGAKWEPIEGLLATAALYQLDRTNTRAPDPAGGPIPVLTGNSKATQANPSADQLGAPMLAAGTQSSQPSTGLTRKPTINELASKPPTNAAPIKRPHSNAGNDSASSTGTCPLL